MNEVRYGGVDEELREPTRSPIMHRLPVLVGGPTPCCDRALTALPFYDRITSNEDLVTCRGNR